MDIMSIKDISPDQVVLWQWKLVSINATILYTWIAMAALVLLSWLGTRGLSAGPEISRWQNLLEMIVGTIRDQIGDMAAGDPKHYLAFVGTLFIFIGFCNFLTIVPGWVAPTASLSTTAALAACVFVSVPIYGIRSLGPVRYAKQYIHPTPFMLPFNIIGELSRTLALAVRLFGNILSGMKTAAILVSLVPLIFPILMRALGLLTGMIQAYIFAVLAMVYIAGATQAQEEQIRKGESG